MNALIFAAGRGERMRPLTDITPKPLLGVGGKRLIEWHLERFAAAGVREVVINTSHLAEQFPAALDDGGRWGLRIRYSYEGPQPLETGGGMLKALSLLGDEPFIAVNGDIWTDFDFSILAQNPPGLAHLVMIDNPAHHPRGDFVLRDGLLHDEASPRLTFAGIGVYRPALLADCKPGIFSIVPSLRTAMRDRQVSGEHFHGQCTDAGTPKRLAELDARLRSATQ
ncbi:MAG: N-acetylmuramate alpha-1-phosphate uridylyltransferase MurU [Rudaea sp.]